MAQYSKGYDKGTPTFLWEVRRGASNFASERLEGFIEEVITQLD